MSIGVSDYVRRDMALKNLIQPLAGEYGMHNNEPQGESRAQQGKGLGLGGGAGRLQPALHPTAARSGQSCTLLTPPTAPRVLFPAARTHRELFSMWYADLMREPLEALMAASPAPAAAVALYEQMMRDIMTAPCADPIEQVGGW